ncbi:MAG: TrpB-like pyridoxal phosphate-dependent enzyme [Conexivisphaerales archaeon]
MTSVHLGVDELPTEWYNILPHLPEPLPPPLDPTSMQPIDPSKAERIFAKELIRQEISSTPYIPIPNDVMDAYRMAGRPTPLLRARKLEEYLSTPAEIYFKAEALNIAGSHKINTALAQAYYNKEQGIERVVTETGAGQWGSALAIASSIFGLKAEIYMVKASYEQKPGRKIIMETFGAKIRPSPSDNTEFGRSILKENPNHPGSLGIAISEAIEDTLTHDDTRYCLGSVLNHVLLHQTVVGQEAKKQMEAIDRVPDVVIGCIGGGSNFAGFAYPFIHDKLTGKKKDIQFVAVEPSAVPSTTKGKYEYDYGDTGEKTFLVKMYTLGHKFTPPPIHAGGLRYHGKAPSLCLLINKGIVGSVAYNQTEVFAAGKIFAQNTGIIPAPESAHAVKKAIDEALEARKKNERRIIIFNLSGHGLLDLSAYEAFNSGILKDYEYKP